MSRAPLVLSAAAVFCAASFFALADGRGAIASAVAKGDSVGIPKSAAKQQELEHRLSRHYRGYDEAPSATIVGPHRV